MVEGDPPRPQFRRSRWINLNGEWAFAFDDDDAGLADGWQNVVAADLRYGSPFDRTITVPFCYQSKSSGIGDSAFHDVVWYARELEETALIVGANRFQIFTRVVLPLSKAPLATLAILSFLTDWNDFLWPLYVLFNAPDFTLQPALGIFQSSYTTNYTIIMMAGGVLATVLPLLLYIFAQRYIIEGVSRSGLKG